MTKSNKQPRNFNGSIVNIRMSANDNDSAISIIEHKMPYGYAPPLHLHQTEDEVFHILRGRLRFEVGDETFTAQAGDILVAPKGIPHRFVVESLDGAHGLTITSGSDFETMVVEMSEPVQHEFLPVLFDSKPNIDALTAACVRNKIDILGPPLAA
jgi:quercetin dioxygenase-like cupin family protein